MRALLALTLCQAANALMVKTSGVSVDQFQEDYLWIFVLGIFFAFFMAWGIGANDVANSFASSVGSKALTLKQAVVIATIVEFTGCVTMGASVTDTVRKGIIDGAFFEDNPEVLMLGMLSALLGAGLWLCLCSFLGSPVSTTHSIIGSLIGVSLTMNPDSLNAWQIFLVVLSWFASPLCSGLLAASIYLFVRTFILRSANPVERGLKFFPVLLFFTYGIVCMYTVFKNPQVDLKAWRKENEGPAIGVAFSMAFVFTAVTYAASIGKLKRDIADCDDVAADKGIDNVTADQGIDGATAITTDQPKAEENQKEEPKKKEWMWNKDLEAEANADDGKAVADLQNCEKFSLKTEKLFSFLQVICASFGALAHGANDVANAVGPLAAIVGIYTEGGISSKVDVPIWILILGGAGISVGLLTYGYNVIKAIGMKLIKVTPTRGFAIEIGAFLVVIIGTNLGIPLSTTHCKVGATVAVGMCEAGGVKNTGKGVNWKLFGKIGSMWVLTLAFASIIASSMFAVLTAAFHPMSKPLNCPLLSNKLSSATDMGTLSTASDMEALFAQLDVNNDDLLDTDELAARCLDQLAWDGEGDEADVTVEKFGRRRRRTPEDMDVDDFLDFTCTSTDNLDHMMHKQCQPMCPDGYVPNRVLKCKLDGENEVGGTGPDAGGFILKTEYSGFTHCVLRELHDFPSTAGTCSR